MPTSAHWRDPDLDAMMARFPPASDVATRRPVITCPECGERLIGPPPGPTYLTWTVFCRGDSDRAAWPEMPTLHRIVMRPYPYMLPDWPEPVYLWMPDAGGG